MLGMGCTLGMMLEFRVAAVDICAAGFALAALKAAGQCPYLHARLDGITCRP